MKAKLGYRSGSSLIHNLHPLLKLAWLIYLTAVVFLFAEPYFNLSLLLVLIVLFPLIGIKLGELQGLKVLLITALLIFILQILFWRDGDLLVRLGSIQITRQGISRGIYLAARFITVVLVSYLFVLTTSPNQLAYALMKAGLPYRYGFTFVTALRMIPLFEEEVRTVYRAQQVRGVSYRPARGREFWSNLTGFTLPMLVSAMEKVDSLSISMEGRCFGMYPTRTYFKVRERYLGDFWAGLALILSILLALIIKIWEV